MQKFDEFLIETFATAGRRNTLSLYQLSKATGISRTQIANYAKGYSEPTISNADKTCKALGVKLVLGK